MNDPKPVNPLIVLLALFAGGYWLLNRKIDKEIGYVEDTTHRLNRWLVTITDEDETPFVLADEE
jgi:hypothetical protein